MIPTLSSSYQDIPSGPQALPIRALLIATVDEDGMVFWQENELQCSSNLCLNPSAATEKLCDFKQVTYPL